MKHPTTKHLTFILLGKHYGMGYKKMTAATGMSKRRIKRVLELLDLINWKDSKHGGREISAVWFDDYETMKENN